MASGSSQSKGEYVHKPPKYKNLSEIDPEDFEAILEFKEYTIKEQWIKIAETRLMQQQLSKCYRREGVNHWVKCRHLAEQYLKMVKENRFEGWRKWE
ncbi:hypothetical protein G9A89_005811 [Geosiphon pyriformis]|nr:hypothetical protein G9A89_005811 [Geosiphon pyriformis]